jgi:hypothetical protein
VQTIALIAVREGVVQLGSMKKVPLLSQSATAHRSFSALRLRVGGRAARVYSSERCSMVLCV